MSRKILALPLLAALALVGCDDSSSSSSSGGKCDGFKGTWVLEETDVERGDTTKSKVVVVFSSSAYSVQTDLVSPLSMPKFRASGAVKDIGSSKIVVTPKSLEAYDEELEKMVAITGVESFFPDTLIYSFPSSGKMAVRTVSNETEDADVFTCQ